MMLRIPADVEKKFETYFLNNKDKYHTRAALLRELINKVDFLTMQDETQESLLKIITELKSKNLSLEKDEIDKINQILNTVQTIEKMLHIIHEDDSKDNTILNDFNFKKPVLK